MSAVNPTSAPIPTGVMTNCWQKVCENKKTIVVATATVAAAVAVAAYITFKQECLYDVQDSLTKIVRQASGLKNVFVGGGMTSSVGIMGLHQECPRFYTPYKLDVELSKSAPDTAGLLNQVKELYNNATEHGSDLFSAYTSRATLDSVVPGNDKVRASFLICKSGFNNLFSAPWLS